MGTVFGENQGLSRGSNGFIGLPASASENAAFLEGSSASYPPKLKSTAPLKVSSRNNSGSGSGWLPKLFQRGGKKGTKKDEEYHALVGPEDDDTVFDVGKDSDSDEDDEEGSHPRRGRRSSDEESDAASEA
jgi:hypothetical protein